MSDDRRLSDHLLSDHLLSESTGEERRAVERRLAEDPDQRTRVHGLEAVTDQLRAMSAAAWEASAAAEPASAGRRRTLWWPRRPVTMPAMATALVATVLLFAAGVGTGALISSAGTGARVAGRSLALAPLPGTPATAGGVAYLTGSNRLVLVIDHLPSTARSHYYEAWLMTNTKQLVPIASFRVDARDRARLELQLPAPARAYRYIDVSLQSSAGGTGHSAVSVLRGPTSAG